MSTARADWLRLAMVLAAVTVVWIVAWLVRLRYASPNVDDYLYTMVAHRIWVPLSSGDLLEAVNTVLETGQNAPLVPALGAPLSPFGPDVTVLLQLPLLLTLTALVFLLVYRVSGTRGATIAASITALSPPVLCWSVMVHMALASSVCALGVMHAYLRSDGFTRRRPSVFVGLWMGLLALSRSMAPVYVSMLCISLIISVLVFHRPKMKAQAGHVALAVAVAITVAGPWYWKSGLTALLYLAKHGYSSSSGFVEAQNPLFVRLMTSWRGMGYALCYLLVFIFVVCLYQRKRGYFLMASDGIARETRWTLFTFAGLVLAFLSTSSDAGTAFDLPVIAALIPALVACLPPRGPGLELAAIGGSLVVVLAVLQASLAPGWEARAYAAPAPAYAGSIVSALEGSGLPGRAKALTMQISRIVGDHSLFVTRDDAVVNLQGLTYFKLENGLGGAVNTHTYDRDNTQVTVPNDYDFVLEGESCAPYHRNIDRNDLQSSLSAGGWSTVLAERLSPCNELVLWRRGRAPETATQALFARITRSEIGDGYGQVDLRGDSILIHPGATRPTTIHISLGGGLHRLAVRLAIAELDEAGKALPEAGTVNAEFMLDGKSILRAYIDRTSTTERTLDVTGGQELAVRVDNANGKDSWDWFTVSALTLD